MTTETEVQLVFPAAQLPPGSVNRSMIGDEAEEIAVRIGDVTNWFKDFDIDSIEVSISTCIQTSGVIKLLLSAQGQGGFTVTLKPKKQPSS